MAWSGGKDSALAFWEMQRIGDHEVVALLTTVTEGYDRISMHGVRRMLLAEQARSLGVPLQEVFIAKQSSNQEYEAKMGEALMRFRREGISRVGFGDIFLEDLRRHREERLAEIGMTGIFPLWKKNTLQLIETFLDLGFEAAITCVDSRVLARSFAGRTIDREFIDDLPAGVDACGENGEFHSFVFAGPIFKERISYRLGRVETRDSFCFCDLLPVQGSKPLTERRNEPWKQ